MTKMRRVQFPECTEGAEDPRVTMTSLVTVITRTCKPYTLDMDGAWKAKRTRDAVEQAKKDGAAAFILLEADWQTLRDETKKPNNDNAGYGSVNGLSLAPLFVDCMSAICDAEGIES
jgi:hypothetical protein